jgi:hypothetical protein
MVIKKIFVVLLALLCPVTAFCSTEQIRAVVGMAKTVGYTCSGTPTVDNSANTNGSTYYVGRTTDNYYAGQSAFNPGADASVCKISFFVRSVGNVTGKTYTARVWTMSGTSLNSNIGSSDSIGGGSWSTEQLITFTFSIPVSLTNGTSYGITLDGGGYDATNYLEIRLKQVTGNDISGAYRNWHDDKVVGQAATTDTYIKIYYGN